MLINICNETGHEGMISFHLDQGETLAGSYGRVFVPTKGGEFLDELSDY
jgi:hypothetical protein